MIPSYPGLLMVGNFLSGTNYTRSAGEELAQRLAAAGWALITTSNQTGRVARLVDMVFTVIAHRQAYQIAYVEVYSGRAFIWAEVVTLLVRLLRKPVILILHGGKLPEFAQRQPQRIQRLLQAANYVTTPSRYLQETFSIPDVIPNALDLRTYTYRHRQNVQPRLVWLRAFHNVYNPEMAIKTVLHLIDDFPTITLTMIGPDKGDGSLNRVQHMIDTYHLSDHVHMTGPVPKPSVPEQLNHHDIFINTTTAESFGVAVLEAAACGLPIVTTNVGELSYRWTHQQDALLVASDDDQAMANQIRHLITDPDLAATLSHNARQQALACDWQEVLSHWEKLFQDVVGRHS